MKITCDSIIIRTPFLIIRNRIGTVALNNLLVHVTTTTNNLGVSANPLEWRDEGARTDEEPPGVKPVEPTRGSSIPRDIPGPFTAGEI